MRERIKRRIKAITNKIKTFIRRDAVLSAEAAAIAVVGIYVVIMSGAIDASVIISCMLLLCIATVCWYYVAHQNIPPKEKRAIAVVKTVIVEICFTLMIAMLLISQLTDKGTKTIRIAFPVAALTASLILVQGRLRAHRAERVVSAGNGDDGNVRHGSTDVTDGINGSAEGVKDDAASDAAS